jgi:hypothetical protein
MRAAMRTFLALVLIACFAAMRPAVAASTTSTLPSAQVGVDYDMYLACANVSGTLPPGLQCIAGGELKGIPTTPGTFTFTGYVNDGRTLNAFTYSLTVLTDSPITPVPGHWWTPDAGGTGMTIQQSSDKTRILIFYYAYTDDGRPDWVYTTASQITPNTYTGQLWHCANGQPTLSQIYTSPNCGAFTGAATNLTVTFTAANRASVMIGSKAIDIQPYVF